MEEIKSAAELRGQTPPFVASQSGAVNAPTANEEAQLRALFQEASANGLEMHDQVSIPAQAQIAIPEKFKTPEGTVDEEKLKASSKLLDGAIEQKQKSIEEIMADYKAKEKQLHELGAKKSELQKQAPVISPSEIPANPNDPQVQQLHQQIMADMQRDPVQTSIMLTEALLAKKLEPIMERYKQEEEMRQDAAKRDSLAQVAQDDPRILQYYSVVSQILDEDPGLMRLKNPHKAAWNEAKSRLRLGEPLQVQAQPSNASPNLGRGVPPSVSGLSAPSSPQNMYQQATSLNPYSDEGKAYEQKLRDATKALWQ